MAWERGNYRRTIEMVVSQIWIYKEGDHEVIELRKNLY